MSPKPKARAPKRRAREFFGAAPAKRGTESFQGYLTVTPRGHGFVDENKSEKGDESVLVEAEHFADAIDGDLVEAKRWRDGRRWRGTVVRVIERGRRWLLGRLEGPPWRLVTDNVHSLGELVFENAPPELARGKMVRADIVHYPAAPGDSVLLSLAEVIGEPGEIATEVKRVLVTHGIEEIFSSEVLKSLPDSFQLTSKELLVREDLRAIPFVTIDPETARDFDDAVYVEPHEHGGVLAYVAVADVSHYVPEDSPLDAEARRRGFSVYLPDRAISMLPAGLSADICSLLPEEDRLAMVVRFVVDRRGDIHEPECLAAVIRSHGRLDYPGVAQALATRGFGSPVEAKYEPHLKQLQELKQVASILHRRRMKRGSLAELEIPEPFVVLGEDDPGRVQTIVSAKRNRGVRQAYQMVEELMLAANESVAQLFVRWGEPTLWRVHAPPSAEALEKLSGWLWSYGIKVRAEDLATNVGMAHALEQVMQHPASEPLAYLVLRSLARASYSTKNVGHFGLASDAYLHFTSPIRRYPDLQVHRLIKHHVFRKIAPVHDPARTARFEQKDLAPLADESVETERRSVTVERQVQSVYAASLMRDHIGEEFEGIVVGLASFGMFVRIREPLVEGMVRLDALADPLEFAEDQLKLLNSRGQPVVALGDLCRVLVLAADPSSGRTDFELIELKGKPVAAYTPKRESRTKPERAKEKAPRAKPKQAATETKATRKKTVRGRGN